MMASPGGENASGGLFAALKGLLATLVATGRLRLELLVTELEEEKLRVLDLLVGAAAAVFLLALGIVLAIACLAAAFWEQRVLVFGGCAVLTLLSGLFFALRLRARLKQPPALFRTSLRELGKDIDALRSVPNDPS